MAYNTVCQIKIIFNKGLFKMLTTYKVYEIFSEITYLSLPRERMTVETLERKERDRYPHTGSVGGQGRSRHKERMIESTDGEYVPKKTELTYGKDKILADVNMSKVIKFGGSGGMEGPKFSILATNCPMPKVGIERTSKTSIDRFWNVAFSSERVDGIVVLGDVTKDESIIDYWSESSSTDPRFYDEDSFYQIESTKEEEGSGYVRYKIKIYETKDSIHSKTINLWHYTNWPDGKTPTNPYDFENFVEMFVGNRKLIVHCSAGVGRTGLFAACLAALKLRRIGDKANPKELVEFMRIARTRMVHTAEQFDMLCKFVARNCLGDEVDWWKKLSEEIIRDIFDMYR